MNTIIEYISIFLLAIVLVICFSFILAFPVMWLWNWLITLIFGLTTLTYWQSWGLMVLCGLLFRSTSVGTRNS